MISSLQDIISENNRLKLSSMKLFWHYSFAILLLFIPLIAAFFMFQIRVIKNYTGLSTFKDWLAILVYSSIASAVLFFFQYRNLRFKIIQSNISLIKFEKIIEKTGKELQWNIHEKGENYLIAETGLSLTSRGERITIIKKNNSLFINSISLIGLSFGFGINKRNINAFIKQLNQ